jgi:hypothetical protein
MRAAVHLRIVRADERPSGAPEPTPARRAPDSGDLALVTGLLLINVIPVACELAGIGRWSPAAVGFAAGALLLTGRELWSQVRARARWNAERESAR